jgi:hypothetical protein
VAAGVVGNFDERSTVNRRHATSKRTNKRLERKAFRAAERRALQGGRERSLRTMSYWTPSSLRKDKLPMVD